MNLLNLKWWHTATPESVKTEIDQGADVNAQDKDGITVLMQASVINKNPEVIATLITNGADVNAKCEDGDTVLMFACYCNCNPEVITTLVNHGADINAKDRKGNTPWTYIQGNRHLKNHNHNAILCAV